jgi:LacI family transcriptional regulator
VTIRDVARAAGVSRQTVTRAINEMSDISEQTRLRVMQTVDELGYRPNRFAIDLSRQRTQAIGLIIGTFQNPYYAQLADAVVSEFRSRGWQVAVGTADSGEADAIRSMAPQVDAIIGYFPYLPEGDFASLARGVPIIQLERRATVAGVHSIELDFEAGMTELVDALRKKGARRFGMIDAIDRLHPQDEGGSPRRQLFEAAVGSSCTIVTETESIAGGMNGFRSLVDAAPDVDAVLAFNDLMAMGAVQSARTLGIDVPGQVRIIGIDGISLGEATSPTLSTLSLETQVVAAEAAAILSQIFTRAAAPSTSITKTVIPRVLWRESA